MSTTATQPILPGSDPAQPLRIVRLEAESFKRLRVVSITPDGTVVRITGRNGEAEVRFDPAANVATLQLTISLTLGQMSGFLAALEKAINKPPF